MSVADKLTTIAENTPKVYKAGRKFEHDRFWDVFQQHGNRTHYGTRLDPVGHLQRDFWSMDNFFPKYDITPIDMKGMFSYWTKTYQPGVTDWDLAQRLKDCGVVLDTSNLTDITGILDNNDFTHIPFMDFTNATVCGAVGPFEYCEQLVTVDGIRMAETTPINRYFVRCFALENVKIEGVIGQNGLNVSWSTNLSHDSHVSIFNALSTATTGLTVTFSRTAVNKAFETSEGANDGTTSAEWLALVASHDNWTIALG